MDVGKRIQYFRNQKGITVNRLANLAGVSQSYLRDLELGNKQPTVEYLSFICDALGISLSAFFDETEHAESPLDRLSKKQKAALIAFLETMEK